MDSVELVFMALESSNLDPAIIAKHSNAIGEVSTFLNCSEEEAIAFCLLIQLYYNRTRPSINEIIKHLEAKPSVSHNLNEWLAPFVSKKWIRPKINPNNNPLTEYAISDEIIQAVNTGKWSHMNREEINNQVDLIIQFNKLISSRNRDLLTYAELVKESADLVKSNNEIPISEIILDNSNDDETIMLALKICALKINSEEISETNIIDSLKPDYRARIMMVSSLKNNTNSLITSNFISLKTNRHFYNESEFDLCDKVLGTIGTLDQNFELTSFKSLQKILPENITKKVLQFNSTEEAIMFKMFDLVKEKNFKTFCKRMTGIKMKPGVTILLHGYPGTGKTESVLQMAKKSGRIILKADVSSIRNKYVGDTEKSIRELFVDYKKACKHYKKIPILLFNEADSILTTRRSVERGIDQMENTMQNIILEELENFEGIFVATTNMELNLDKAFDRRFLYKVKMQKPSSKTRMGIWKSKFKTFSDSILQELSENYELSGGQIDNVAKKIEVDFLLNGSVAKDIGYLKGVIKSETSLDSANNHRVIGFRITNQ